MDVHSYNLYVYLDKQDYDFDINNIKKSSRLLCKELELEICSVAYHIFEAPYKSKYQISHSGVFLLTTSHLAWHTFPEDGRFHLSISTCGPKISIEKLNSLIKELYLGVIRIEHVPFLS